jgi:hypothetical protein
VSAISCIFVLLDLLLAFDAARRPASVWAAADRRKNFWVPLLALFGVVMVIPYGIGVFPRLVEAERAPAGNDFRKEPSSPSPFEKSSGHRS